MDERYFDFAREELARFDSSLDVRGIFDHGSGLVLKVSTLQAQDCIFKGPYLTYALRGKTKDLPEYDSQIVDFISTEIRALEKLKGVKQVTQLRDVYSDEENYNAILKEFFPGASLEYMDRISDSELQVKILEGVENIHERGIAAFDLDKPANIVVSEYWQDFRFIDFGKCTFEEDVSQEVFRRKRALDYLHLEMHGIPVEKKIEMNGLSLEFEESISC